jgi:hypothetical protein
VRLTGVDVLFLLPCPAFRNCCSPAAGTAAPSSNLPAIPAIPEVVMQVRLALVPLVALVAAVAPVADAAPKAKAKPKPKPSCMAITDPKGDTFAVRFQDAQGAYGPQEDALDIVSGDLASDGKVVTAVVRLSKLSRAINLSPTGFTVGLDFLIGGSDAVVRLQANLIRNAPDRFEVAVRPADAVPNTPSTFVGTVTGVVDEKLGEVRIHAPAELLAPFGPVKPGVKLTPNENESATVARGVPAITTTPGQPMTTRGPFADIAAAGKTVVVGAPSCVVPGK